MEDFLGALLIPIGFWSAIAYVPIQIYTGLKWRGGWRTLALLPLLIMVPILGYTVYAAARESNLWPIVLIFSAPVATVYFLIIAVIRRLVIRSQQGDAS